MRSIQDTYRILRTLFQQKVFSRKPRHWTRSVIGPRHIACAMCEPFTGLPAIVGDSLKILLKSPNHCHASPVKNNTFTWTDETQESFDRLKRALMQTPTLEYPRPDIPCILDTDASDVAVGGVLSQVIDGKERPIAFFSKVLNGAQKNYCPTRREC